MVSSAGDPSLHGINEIDDFGYPIEAIYSELERWESPALTGLDYALTVDKYRPIRFRAWNRRKGLGRPGSGHEQESVFSIIRSILSI